MEIKNNSGNRETSILAGKVMRYRYYEGALVMAIPSEGENPVRIISQADPGIWSAVGEEYVELRFGHMTSTWISLEGNALGQTGTQPCSQIEIAPEIFLVTWLEANNETVTMAINLKEKTVHTSFRHKDALELLKARIVEFGPASEMD